MPTLTQGSGGFQVVVASNPSGTGEGLVVNAPLQNVTVSTGGRISVTVPADAFAHTDANAAVTLVATQASGQALPGWINFNPSSGKFEGTPPPGFRGELSVRVTARDNQGHQVVQVFKIVVGQDRGQGGQRSGMLERPTMLGRSGLSDQLQAARPNGADRLTALARSAKAAMTGRA